MVEEYLDPVGYRFPIFNQTGRLHCPAEAELRASLQRLNIAVDGKSEICILGNTSRDASANDFFDVACLDIAMSHEDSSSQTIFADIA